MTPPESKPGNRSHRRRYLVHLSCEGVERTDACQYVVKIQSWLAGMNRHDEIHQRVFDDECEFIEAINSLLPPGSDVRDVFSHIESPDGFMYLLQLNAEQARTLGWRCK